MRESITFSIEIIVGGHVVMVRVVGNGLVNQSSNPGRNYISHSANTLGKGMNPTTLPPAMGK